MLGCKIANSIVNYHYNYDSELLSIHISLYRKRFLKNSNHKNGYKKVIKGTPKSIEILFAAFDRKINNKSLFKNSEKKIKDYLNGIDLIFNKHYSLKSKFQKPSNIEKYELYVTKMYVDNNYNYIYYTSSKTGRTSKPMIDENLKKEFEKTVLSYEEWIKKGYHLSTK
jgi:hypothetical protein